MKVLEAENGASVPDEGSSEPAGTSDTPVLVDRARERDTEAWARLYQDHYELLLRHLSYLCGDVSVAEDLVQETFARGFENIHRFSGRSRFKTWLYGIARNVARDHHRKTRRGRSAFEQVRLVRSQAGDLEDESLRRRRAADFRAAIDALPDNLREAYMLIDVGQLAPAEAAERLGITGGNASVRAHRARTRLKRAMERLGWFEEDSQ